MVRESRMAGEGRGSMAVRPFSVPVSRFFEIVLGHRGTQTVYPSAFVATGAISTSIGFR
jgi:hypothetical protein